MWFTKNLSSHLKWITFSSNGAKLYLLDAGERSFVPMLAFLSNSYLHCFLCELLRLRISAYCTWVSFPLFLSHFLKPSLTPNRVYGRRSLPEMELAVFPLTWRIVTDTHHDTLLGCEVKSLLDHRVVNRTIGALFWVMHRTKEVLGVPLESRAGDSE